MKEIFIYGDWKELNASPILLGKLKSQLLKGKEIFSFEYDKTWLSSGYAQQLDPDLKLFSGPQYLKDNKVNFGLFLDSSPDRWGRTLMKRREAINAREEGRKVNLLHESDYLLGVNDLSRMGALRLKQNIDGPFLEVGTKLKIPPFSSIRELEQASIRYEEEDFMDNPKAKEWLGVLMAPGSSLGGARPKANIIDIKGNLWIAKFPSKSDDRDSGAWEHIVYQLATEIGIHMSVSRASIYSQKQHTFLTQRFDRAQDQRLHFASAMTLLGYKDGHDHHAGGSYLELIELIEQLGAAPTQDIRELWQRIVFSVAVSNTDDHLRNHGFILIPNLGWKLSPAFDINPVAYGTGLSLNIDEHDNSLSFDLCMQVHDYFRWKEKEARMEIKRIEMIVTCWESKAKAMKISSDEIETMRPAFE